MISISLQSWTLDSESDDTSIESWSSSSETSSEASEDEPADSSWIHKPLYNGAKVTVFDAFILLLQFSFEV